MNLWYRFLRGVVRLFTHKMTTTWETPFDGEPAVFCCNHAGAMGPIMMCARFPLADHLAPWLNDSVRHVKEVPAYVRQDYWWKPGSKLAPLWNCTLPYLAALVLPPILNSVPGVPVYHDMRVRKTFKLSVDKIKAGNSLLIFPEQPSGYDAHFEQLNTGFLLIARMVHRDLGRALKFYPVHLDMKGRVIAVKAPIAYDPDRSLEEQGGEIIAHIRAGI